jgi:exopolysaccharide production protein ExoZ
MGGTLRALQILRFIAAAMVLEFHAINYGMQLAGITDDIPYSGLGAAGVDIFFVLSGAIIYLNAFAGRRPTGFLRRRYLRVAPIYYVVTLAWLPFAPIAGQPHTTLANFAATFLFWPAWTQMAYPALGIGWTLCFEMLFYMSAALVLCTRWMLIPLLLIFVGCWWARESVSWPIFQFLGNPMVIEFALGVLVAALWKPKAAAPAWFGAFFIGLGVAGLMIFSHYGTLVDGYRSLTAEVSGVRVFLWGIPSALIVLGALAIEPYAKRPFLNSLVYLGDASYSIYLVHFPLILVVTRYLQAREVFISLPISLSVFLVVGLGASVAVYQWIERPIRNTAKRFH